MKILDWTPEIGERAIVPGGVACAAYVAPLEATDVRAIERGHRGYSPLYLVMENALTGEVLDSVYFSERFNKWCGCEGGTWDTLDSLKRRASRHFNCRIVFRARNLTKGATTA